jgi:hypothetical protein
MDKALVASSGRAICGREMTKFGDLALFKDVKGDSHAK